MLAFLLRLHILGVLVHHLLDADFHHSEILLGVYMPCFRLILEVLHLADIPLLLLIAINTVVNAS